MLTEKSLYLYWNLSKITSGASYQLMGWRDFGRIGRHTERLETYWSLSACNKTNVGNIFVYRVLVPKRPPGCRGRNFFVILEFRGFSPCSLLVFRLTIDKASQYFGLVNSLLSSEWA